MMPERFENCIQMFRGQFIAQGIDNLFNIYWLGLAQVSQKGDTALVFKQWMKDWSAAELTRTALWYKNRIVHQE